MNSSTFGSTPTIDYLPVSVASHPSCSALNEEAVDPSLSPELLADLLDASAWIEILTTYGLTMKVAVSLTDCQGIGLGVCNNPQAVWSLLRAAVPLRGCPFCIPKSLPCTAVVDALRTGKVAMVRDQAGLTHVAVPLSIGKQPLGAIIAGQVFDRYPEALSLRRVAKNLDIPSQMLWEVARKQRPVSRISLQSSGDLLRVLGHAFVQQRYAAILEAHLAETNRNFRLLVEGVRDCALFTIDTAGRVTSWNVGAQRLLGYTETDVVGHHFSRIYTREDIHNRLPEAQLRKASLEGHAENEGWRIQGVGSKFWGNTSITAFRKGAGAVDGFTVIVQDVTERRKLAIDLEGAREERVRLQDKFLSHVSHELRTPLTAIYFFTTNLLDGLVGDLTLEQSAHLKLALANINQLKEMVSDLLDITRIETHKLTVEQQHASPAMLIVEAASTCQTNAASKSVRLTCDIAPNLPSVWADPARVRQILINLIDNGIKFTPKNGTITTKGHAYTQDDTFVVLSVADTGCGISAENQERVFERLTQVIEGEKPSRSGLGLGLFIARDLVSRHGGRIWVESQPGQGSIFYFTLPIFSLAKLCAHVFTAPNLALSSVTLIAIEMTVVGHVVQADLLPEIKRILERCIRPGQDILLPSMSDTQPMLTFFIIACTDVSGFEVMASRIRRELEKFDNSSSLLLTITPTTLLVEPVPPSEKQIGEITRELDGLIQQHLSRNEKHT